MSDIYAATILKGAEDLSSLNEEVAQFETIVAMTLAGTNASGKARKHFLKSIEENLAARLGKESFKTVRRVAAVAAVVLGVVVIAGLAGCNSCSTSDNHMDNTGSILAADTSALPNMPMGPVDTTAMTANNVTQNDTALFYQPTANQSKGKVKTNAYISQPSAVTKAEKKSNLSTASPKEDATDTLSAVAQTIPVAGTMLNQQCRYKIQLLLRIQQLRQQLFQLIKHSQQSRQQHNQL